MSTVTRVEKLHKDGKSYNIFFKGQQIINLTLEYGADLTKEKAYAIVKDVARDVNIDKSKINPNDITFEQAEPEYD